MLLAAPGITNDKKYIVPPGKENGIFSHKWLGRCGYLSAVHDCVRKSPSLAKPYVFN